MIRAAETARRPAPALDGRDPLARRIAQQLDRRLGRAGRTATVRRRPSPYRSTLPLFEVDASLEDGTLLQLMLKGLGASVDPTSLQARPSFLRDSEREAEVYRRILSRHPVGVPAFYGAWEQDGDRWLLLERVPGVPLWQAVGSRPWARTAEWLGAFHARFAAAPELMADAELRSIDAPGLGRWVARAAEVQRHGPAADRAAAVLDRVEALAPRLRDRILDLPATLIHGEFYPANILVAGARIRVCPVDWEMAARGPGVLDLAALVTGLERDRRGPLIEAYHRGWVERGGDPGLTVAELTRGIVLGRLQFALQWMGWSRHWTPPREQARDWIGEAEEMLEELGR